MRETAETGQTVQYMCHERVATITYNRPEARNAINGALRADLKKRFGSAR